MAPWLELVRVEFKLFIRNVPATFFVLAFPSMMLLTFGGIYGNEPSPLFHGFGTVDVSLPAYTAMIIAANGLMTLPLGLAAYREGRVLKRLRASPISPAHLLLAQFAVMFAATVAGMLLLAVIAVLVFHVRFLGEPLPSLAAFLVAVASTYALGYLLASLARGTGACTVIANLVYFPMIFLSGATIPREIMPKTMQAIADYLPLTHAVALLKGVWLGDPLAEHVKELLILGGVTVGATLGAALTFRWE